MYGSIATPGNSPHALTIGALNTKNTPEMNCSSRANGVTVASSTEAAVRITLLYTTPQEAHRNDPPPSISALRPELLVTHMYDPDALWYVPDESKAKILPLAPSVAAQRQGITLEIDRLMDVYDEISSGHDITLVEGAGGLMMFAMNVMPAAEADFNAWYDQEHVPRLAAVPGCLTALSAGLASV